MFEEEKQAEVTEGEGKIAKIFGLVSSPFKLLFSNKITLILIAIIIAVGATILIAKKKPELLGIPPSQQVVESQEEVNKLVEEVGKIIALPEGETPTVASVTDTQRLSGQKFFERAQNGDKVLVYANAKKAYLYRPSEKRIIEVGVVNVGEQNTQVAGEGNENEISPAQTLTSTPSPSPTKRPLPTNTPIPTSAPTETATPTPQI